MTARALARRRWRIRPIGAESPAEYNRPVMSSHQPDRGKLDRRAIRRRFDRRAAGFGDADFVYRRSADSLLSRLEPLTIEPRHIVDVGVGMPGTLERHYPRASIVAIDDSLAMLRRQPVSRWRARRHRCGAHIGQLPLRDGVADLVVANLTLPRCDDIATALAECQRVLRPEGVFAFSTLGPDSFAGLHEAASKSGLGPGRFGFPDMHDVGDALVGAGFRDPVLDVDFLTIEYSTPARLWADLRASATGNAARNRAAGLVTPRRLARCARSAWSAADGGNLKLTLELIYGHAFGGFAAARGVDPGEYRIEASAIGRRAR